MRENQIWMCCKCKRRIADSFTCPQCGALPISMKLSYKKENKPPAIGEIIV